MIIVSQNENDLMGLLQKVENLREIRYFSAVYSEEEKDGEPHPTTDKFYFISLPKHQFSVNDSNKKFLLSSADLISLERQWDQGHTWGALFDTLFYASHDQSNILLSQSQLSFTLDAFGVWLSDCTADAEVIEIAADASQDDGVWTVYSHPMRSSIVADSSGSGGSSEWEVINEKFASLVITESATPVVPAARPIPTPRSSREPDALTYKDMLLLPPSHPTNGKGLSPKAAARKSVSTDVNGSSVPGAVVLQQKKVWKPSFVVDKPSMQRKDREYVQKDETEVEEEDGYWDLLNAHARTKFQTGVARKRAITMLPPNILEKKTQRINEKMAAANR